MTELIPIALLVVGLLVYALTPNTKVAELGRIAFFCGLFWVTYTFAGHVFRL